MIYTDPDMTQGNARLRAILDELEELPSVGHVAARLIELGIKGECADAHKCAVSVFVARRWREATGQDSFVVTDSAGVIVYNPEDSFTTLLAEWEVGPRVREFIFRFDAEKYPALIA
jgi:hypothetical protein